MGRVIHRSVIAIRCELAILRKGVQGCFATFALTPIPVDCVWEDQVQDLARLVQGGWSFVLTPNLRSYCPDHAERVALCTCRTHPDRSHLCVEHSDTRELVWTVENVPPAVEYELSRNGVAS